MIDIISNYWMAALPEKIVNILLVCYGGGGSGYAAKDSDVTYLIEKKNGREEMSVKYILNGILSESKNKHSIILNIYLSNSFTNPPQNIVNNETKFIEAVAQQHGCKFANIKWIFPGFIDFSKVDNNPLGIQFDVISIVPCAIGAVSYNVYKDPQYKDDYEFICTYKHLRVYSNMLNTTGTLLVPGFFSTGILDPALYDMLPTDHPKKQLIDGAVLKIISREEQLLKSLPDEFKQMYLQGKKKGISFTSRDKESLFGWQEDIIIDGLHTTLLNFTRLTGPKIVDIGAYDFEPTIAVFTKDFTIKGGTRKKVSTKKIVKVRSKSRSKSKSRSRSKSRSKKGKPRK
jgi:hypothetical protein